MDGVAVETVVVSGEDCADRAAAVRTLEAELRALSAPRRGAAVAAGGSAGWVVRVRIVRDGEGARLAHVASAEIVDDGGQVVARRTLTDRGKVCGPLLSAVGAWAQVVLDDEVARPEATKEPAIASVGDGPTPSLDLPRDEPTGRSREIEAGAMMYLRNDANVTGGFIGVSPFVTLGLGGRWMLRPSVAAGMATIPQQRSNGVHVALRGDLCHRVVGNYTDRRGIELDACGGGDVGYVEGIASDRTEFAAVRASVGPAMALRGQIGRDFGLEVRGMTGVNVVRGAIRGDAIAPVFVALAEVGASVRFR